MPAVALVGRCGFLLLGILADRTYTGEPPTLSGLTSAHGQLRLHDLIVRGWRVSSLPFRFRQLRGS